MPAVLSKSGTADSIDMTGFTLGPSGRDGEVEGSSSVPLLLGSVQLVSGASGVSGAPLLLLGSVQLVSTLKFVSCG